jgi:predicted RNA-binding protein
MVSLVRQVSAGLLRHLARNAVALVALFLALSMGTAWALQTNSVTSEKRADAQVKRIVLPKNSVRSKNIVNGQVQRVDLARNSVSSEKIVNGQVKGVDLARGIPYDSGPPVGVLSEATSGNKTVAAKCPKGKTPVTGGAQIYGAGGWGDPPPEGVIALSENTPTWPPATRYLGWRVTAIEVNGGTTESWRLAVVVVCAKVNG